MSVLADQSSGQWIDAGLLMERIPNNADTRPNNARLAITYENLKLRLNISEKLLKKTFIVFRADVVDPP